MTFSERYGPWAVVAGASEGIGRAFAGQIAAQGVRCLLIARREGPLAEAARAISAETGTECVTAAIDLAAPDAHRKVVEAVGGREVGLYVGNAGADPNGRRFLDNDIENWLDLVRRNVMTTMQCCHHFGRLMRERRRGGLLLVNSYAAYGGGSFLGTYSGSKAFELCFTEGLWAELRPFGVDVLGLVLGMTDTPAFRTLLERNGLALPAAAADPQDVARLGLERLPHGPVCNWGLADDAEAGGAASAAARRARVLAMEEPNKAVFGDA